jgi:hypothetical protein
MGRPKILDEAKMMPVILDRETRAIVEKKKGDRGVSSFIRDLIRGDMDKGVDSEDLVSSLQIRLKAAEAKVYAFEKKEKAVSKEKEEAMAYIANGLELYKNEDVRRADNPETCRRWIDARCKGSGISASDFLSYQVSREDPATYCRDE